MNEDEHILAVKIMADAMERGAHYYGPNHSQISGDKHIFAERALRELLTRFSVTPLSNDQEGA